jgi:hypothetical protein
VSNIKSSFSVKINFSIKQFATMESLDLECIAEAPQNELSKRSQSPMPVSAPRRKLGEFIRRERIKASLTLENVSMHTQYQVTTITSIESCQIPVPEEFMTEFCKLINISVFDFSDAFFRFLKSGFLIDTTGKTTHNKNSPLQC